MNQDSGIPLTSLKVDGGMTANSLLMQIQADLLGIPVGRVERLSLITHVEVPIIYIFNVHIQRLQMFHRDILHRLTKFDF